jgi:hypothetical protein
VGQTVRLARWGNAADGISHAQFNPTLITLTLITLAAMTTLTAAAATRKTHPPDGGAVGMPWACTCFAVGCVVVVLLQCECIAIALYCTADALHCNEPH